MVGVVWEMEADPLLSGVEADEPAWESCEDGSPLSGSSDWGVGMAMASDVRKVTMRVRARACIVFHRRT